MNRKDDFGYVWRKVVNVLAVNAPLPVAEALAKCEATAVVRGTDFILTVPEAVKEYMEEQMSCVKPVLWPYIKRLGCTRMVYKTYQHGKKSS